MFTASMLNIKQLYLFGRFQIGDFELKDDFKLRPDQSKKNLITNNLNHYSFLKSTGERK